MTAIAIPSHRRAATAAATVHRRVPIADLGLTVAAACVAAALLTSLAQTCAQSVRLGEQRRQAQLVPAGKVPPGDSPSAPHPVSHQH